MIAKRDSLLKKCFIYLAAPGLSCGKQDLSRRHVGSSVAGMWNLIPWPGVEPGLSSVGA